MAVKKTTRKTTRKTTKKTTKKAKTYKGKSLRLGGGGRFARDVDKLVAQGVPRKVAEARVAYRGRRKYGAAKMAKWSAAGRKRAARKRTRRK